MPDAFCLASRPGALRFQAADLWRKSEVTILCDFQWVHGVGTGVDIGDNQPVWEQLFSTGGRHKNGHAVLVFMVRALTVSNGAEVG